MAVQARRPIDAPPGYVPRTIGRDRMQRAGGRVKPSPGCAAAAYIALALTAIAFAACRNRATPAGKRRANWHNGAVSGIRRGLQIIVPGHMSPT